MVSESASQSVIRLQLFASGLLVLDSDWIVDLVLDSDWIVDLVLASDWLSGLVSKFPLPLVCVCVC